MATRRNQQSSPSIETMSVFANGKSSPTSPSITKPIVPRTSPLSPYLPTRLEALLLSTYPATLLLGGLFATLNPVNSGAPYSAEYQSHDPSTAPSYFAQKRNIFNVVFVKRGWFWTTVALFTLIFTHPSFGPRGRFVLTPRRIRATIRWGMSTLCWTAVTQWFFGAPLIDRGFRFTGGKCHLSEVEMQKGGSAELKEVLSHTACKLAGGRWRGGHDISGHVFILILASGLLWMEVLPAILRSEGLREQRLIKMRDGSIKRASTEMIPEAGEERETVDTGLGVKIALGVVALSWWMLLMTAAYFHTWLEKSTGLLVAFLALYVIYFLPRALPGMRAVVGMPGV